MDLSIELTDGVVLLRPFQLEDAKPTFDAICESLNDLKPWMGWAHDGYQPQENEEYIRISRARWEEGTLFSFAITDVNSGEILGGCGLGQKNPVHRFSNLGYWVRTSRHGRGIAGRAAKLAARFGFECAGIIRAEIVVAVGNEKSRRVAEKIGAHDEGILLNRMVVGKTIYDAHMFSLLPSDFDLEVRV
ncbi:MAG: GNAT family N-acetyltransferase [Chloroflexi bacterium]|nr:GNAT family N-acetyltransferase [Chloroflexota bacterium]